MRWVLITALSLVTATALAEPLDQSAPECVTVEARPFLGAYGTNHAVAVTNHCERPVRCDVATDVDPEPRQTLTVRPGDTAVASTRLESPARVFTPLYHCDLL
jgi:hypothetical protein